MLPFGIIDVELGPVSVFRLGGFKSWNFQTLESSNLQPRLGSAVATAVLSFSMVRKKGLGVRLRAIQRYSINNTFSFS